MTRAHGEDTVRDSESAKDAHTNGHTVDTPASPPEDEEDSDLELIEATPTPVVVPVATLKEAPSRPPPLPRTVVPPPPPRSAVPPPPPTPHRAPPPPQRRVSPPRVPPASIAPARLPLPSVGTAASQPVAPEEPSPEQAVADARKRVEQYLGNGTIDRLAHARARTELGILLEVMAGDGAAALVEYRAAHAMAAAMLAPIVGARRLTPLRPAAPALALLEAELRTDQAAPVTKRIELGMLLSASGASAERTWQAYRDVLAREPNHPGALRGLESALTTAPRAAETPHQLDALAAHLETMASAFRDDAKLAAWLHVERGQLLERLGREEAACAALEAALALDGGVGPVRDAYTRHLRLHDKVDALIEAWSDEARLETDGARAAHLLYFAGRLASERLGQPARATDLYEQSAARQDVAPAIRQASLRELARLYETAGNLDAAVTATERMVSGARDAELGYLHRSLVRLCEALDRPAEAARHAQQALMAEPDDEPLRERLDRALSALGQHEQRVATLIDAASRTADPGTGVDLLLRAAHVAEYDWGRADVALSTLRSAWAIDPGRQDTCDAIARLLTPGTSPSPADPADPARLRARTDFYLEASAAAADGPRKIAHLEKLAALWEDEVREPARAMLVFDEILALDPNRRSAVLGKARCAARAGNARELLRALLLEADQSGGNLPLERSLLLRAAEIASKQLADHDTALDLVKRVLGKSPSDTTALQLGYRVHERAGRQAEALAHLRLLLTHSKKGAAGYPLQAEIARFLDVRMHRPGDAITAWREAHRMNPGNPTPRAEIRRLLLACNDHRTLADEIAALAANTTSQPERAELFLEAAEMLDDRLGDPEGAIPLLLEARVGLPDDPAVVERLDGAYLRTGKKVERMALLHTTESPHARAQLALGCLQSEERDPTRAIKRLMELVADPTTGVAAMRTLEHVLRRAERWSDLDVLLRKQIDGFGGRAAKLGSAYELVALEEVGGVPAPDGQPRAYEILARLAPDDLYHHELFLRGSGLAMQRDARQEPVVAALGTMAAAQSDALTAGSLQLLVALLLDRAGEQHVQARKEALVAYAICLESWPDCLTAARGVHRLALQLDEHALFVKAATALGALELDPSVRCARLLEAAHGSRALPDGTKVTTNLACKALDEDPNSEPAADAIIAMVGHGLDAGRASETLRSALDRVMSPEQAAKLGAALAHVAVRYLDDPTVAIEALRRARKRAPKHTGNLLALAELGASMGLHAEAVDAASSALGTSKDPMERLRATVTLAEVHARAPAFRDTARREAGEADRLLEQVTDADGELLARLGAIHTVLGNEAAAEKTLIRAVVLGVDGALTELQSLYGSGPEANQKLAGALAKVIDVADANGRPHRPEWLATLGKVEAVGLGKRQEGLARVREAVRMSPGLVDVHRALVDAHAEDHDAAARDLLAQLPLFARSTPSSASVVNFLSLVSQACRTGHRAALAELADDLLGDWTPSSGAVERQRDRALPMNVPTRESLSRATLVASVFPDQDQLPLLDVALLIRDPLDKLLRREPEAVGVSADSRLPPHASHPARRLADRLAQAFGEPSFDLYVDVPGIETPAILPGTPPALLLPPGFSALDEVGQAATLARLLTYVALGVPWVDGLAPDDLDGVLWGALRVGFNLWGQGEVAPDIEPNVARWKARIGKGAGRRLKRSLDEIAQRTKPQATTLAFRQSVRAAGLRAAFALTGDVRATMALAIENEDDLRESAPASLPGRLFEHPVAREVLVFALSEAGLALCQSTGSL